MIVAMAVAPRPQYERRKPELDATRKAFCRQLPCLVPKCHGRAEAAHVGPHALGRKADDSQTLPICAWHHKLSPYSLHALGPVKFQEYYKVDFAGWLTEINEWYAREVSREPEV